MTYTINDQYHQFTLTMATNITDYTNLYFNVWTTSNHSSTPSLSVVATNPRKIGNKWYYDFIVTNDSFNDGDELDKFVVEYRGVSSTVKLWDTHEGVVYLYDGNNEKEIHSSDTYTLNNKKYGVLKLKFENEGSHSIQAVYSGNKTTKMSYTPLENFMVKDTSSESGSSPKPVKGGYKLVFNNKSVLKNLVCADRKKIYFKLTQNGNPVANKTVEIVTPAGNSTAPTNAKGLCAMTNTKFNAGNYTIGAFFVQDGRIRAKVYEKITIKKNTPKLTWTHKPLYNSKNVYLKKHRVYFKLTNHLDVPIKNARLSIYHNNQLKQIKTNDKGYVSMDVGVGRHTFKTTWNGSRNFAKITLNRSTYVSKKPPE